MDWKTWIENCPTGGRVFKDWLYRAPIFKQPDKPDKPETQDEEEEESLSDFNF